MYLVSESFPPSSASSRQSRLPGRRFWTPVVLTLLLLPLALVGTPGVGATSTRTLVITAGTAHPTVPFKSFDGNPPKLYDIDGDGTKEIIAQNDNQYVYVFNSRTGTMLAELTTKFPSGWGARSFDGPEVSYMQAGGATHLIIQNSAAEITSFRFDPNTSSSGHFGFVKEWERHLTDCFAAPGSDSKPTLVDLDRDGTFEILAATEESGLYALRADGSILWKKCIGGGNADMVAGDLDGDGWPEVAFGSDGGQITVMNGRTGATKWGYYVPAHFQLGPASMPVGVAIGQVDGVGGLDIVAGVRDAHNGTDFTKDHAMLLALSTNGALLWAKQDLVDGAPLTYTHPVIVDADHNGRNEVYWADWNTIGHKPPATEADSWKVTGPAHFYRFDGAGNVVWKQTLGTWWNNKDLTLADVDGNGVQDVFANGPGTNGHDGIWFLDSNTGAKEAFVDVYPFKVGRAPVVADLWNTGTMQWVVEVGQLDASAGGPGILVYDTHVPYSAVFPHLPDPTLSTPAPPPPPPGARFDATFTIHSPNEWWQEVTIAPVGDHTVTRMQMRTNGGAWMDMAKSSWGAWTKSVHTVAGTQVEFLATDSTNGPSQSQPFTWLDGTLSKGSTTGTTTTTTTSTGTTTATTSTTSTTTTSTTSTTTGPPPSFTATFTPSANKNAWWVETSVSSNQPVVGVEAKINGGAFVALDHTSWGTWAKSINAPAGSAVQFRATSSTGATALSSTYTW